MGCPNCGKAYLKLIGDILFCPDCTYEEEIVALTYKELREENRKLKQRIAELERK